MTKKARAQYIIDALEQLYPETPVPLDHSDAYTLLVAVMLSAQSTDKKVNQITPALFATAHTPEKMAALQVPEIKELIKEIGLSNTKAKNLQALSAMICDEFGGQVPDNFTDLERLPGVGHKTASVVMAQAFGVPAFPVDTHIHRLLALWKISNGKSVEKTEEDAKKAFPKALWNKLHLQIIFYGREYSPARGWRAEKDFITAHLLA
jgi:endonuclease III